MRSFFPGAAKTEKTQLSRADVPSHHIVRFTAAKQRLMMT